MYIYACIYICIYVNIYIYIYIYIVHGSTTTPGGFRYFMVKMCNCPTAPPKKNSAALYCNRPPLVVTSQRVQAGLGLGLGVQVQGQAELELGGQGVLGRLPDHSSLPLLKSFNFCYRPTTTPFRNTRIVNHRPVTAPTKKL
jgi:hypothetical protein